MELEVGQELIVRSSFSGLRKCVVKKINPKTIDVSGNLIRKPFYDGYIQEGSYYKLTYNLPTKELLEEIEKVEYIRLFRTVNFASISIESMREISTILKEKEGKL